MSDNEREMNDNNEVVFNEMDQPHDEDFQDDEERWRRNDLMHLLSRMMTTTLLLTVCIALLIYIYKEGGCFIQHLTD